jgi:PAS domain S-box-containing protein
MALRGEKEFDTEFRVLWPDGTIRTIRALAIVQRDTNGEPLRMIGTNWDITEQTNAEKALRENDLLLRLILSLSAQFINISSDKIYLEISLALGELGRFAGVDRSYVFLLSPDGMTMDNTHEWCAEGIVAEKDNLQGLPTSMFPWWMERIRLFETIHVPRVADLPPEAENEREILAAQGIQSVLIVPLISQNTLIGFLGFDSVSHEKTWPDNIITLVTITGKSISNAIERERAEEALRRSEEQLSLALEGSNVGLWDWHVQTGATIFNERWAGILGYTLAELSPVSIKTWESLCHPDDLARSGELLQSHFSGKTPTYECEARMKHKEGHWVWVLDRGKVVEWDEAGRPARMTGTHLDITERVHHEEAIAASLREKETLLKEIHHRVKNNMQVISSLLNLQAKKIRDKNTLEIFRESQNRVRSIALIHEKLYRSKSLSQVDFQDFLQQLAENLFLSYGVRKDLVSFTISADEIYLPIDKAIPLGLITNELLTNSLKYAFPGQCKGTISIDLQKDKENYRYTFSDDGVGFPDDVEFDPGSDGNDTAQTLGLQLVIALVGQLQGTVILNRVNGTVFMIRFVYEEKGDDQD